MATFEINFLIWLAAFGPYFFGFKNSNCLSAGPYFFCLENLNSHSADPYVFGLENSNSHSAGPYFFDLENSNSNCLNQMPAVLFKTTSGVKYNTGYHPKKQ